MEDEKRAISSGIDKMRLLYSCIVQQFFFEYFIKERRFVYFIMTAKLFEKLAAA